MESFLISFLVILILGLATIVVGSSKAQALSSTSFLLQYSTALKIVVLSLPAAFVVLVVVAGVYSPPTGSEVFIFTLLLAFPSLFLILISVEFFKVKIIVSDRGVYSFSPWREDRFLRWDDISLVHYSKSNRWFKLNSSNKKVIRVSCLLGGHDIFVLKLVEKLPLYLYEDALNMKNKHG